MSLKSYWRDAAYERKVTLGLSRALDEAFVRRVSPATGAPIHTKEDVLRSGSTGIRCPKCKAATIQFLTTTWPGIDCKCNTCSYVFAIVHPLVKR